MARTACGRERRSLPPDRIAFAQRAARAGAVRTRSSLRMGPKGDVAPVLLPPRYPVKNPPPTAGVSDRGTPRTSRRAAGREAG